MIRSLRTSSAIVALFAASAVMASPGTAQPDGGADLILRGGTIYSGEAAPFRGDVAIRGDRIIYVGPKAPGTAARTTDATGLIVAPGFIDPPTHVGEAPAPSAPPARPLPPFFPHGDTPPPPRG